MRASLQMIKAYFFKDYKSIRDSKQHAHCCVKMFQDQTNTMLLLSSVFILDNQVKFMSNHKINDVLCLMINDLTYTSVLVKHTHRTQSSTFHLHFKIL